MKILISLLLLIINNFGYCDDEIIQFNESEENRIILVFNRVVLGYQYKIQTLENVNTIPIKITANSKNIKTIELIDEYSQTSLCRQKPIEKYPKTIVKFKLNPDYNVKTVSTRIRLPCINKYVSPIHISKLSVVVTTSKNKIFSHTFVIIFAIPNGIYGTLGGNR